MTMEYTYKYPRPAVTADCVVITREAEPKVLLIQRGDQPFKGGWAFPGGFMNMDETEELSPLLISLSLMNQLPSLAKMMLLKQNGGHYQISWTSQAAKPSGQIWHLTIMTSCRMLFVCTRSSLLFRGAS